MELQEITVADQLDQPVNQDADQKNVHASYINRFADYMLVFYCLYSLNLLNNMFNINLHSLFLVNVIWSRLVIFLTIKNIHNMNCPTDDVKKNKKICIVSMVVYLVCAIAMTFQYWTGNLPISDNMAIYTDIILNTLIISCAAFACLTKMNQ